MTPLILPTVFQKAGVWVSWPDHWDWRNSERDPAVLARNMKDNGFKWLVVKVAHGDEAVNHGFIAENGWLRPFHNRGIFVGGWGWLAKTPIAEAEVAHEQISRLKLDFYIANAEETHKADSQGGDPGRSRVFCSEFRRLRPKILAGFSTYWGTTWKTLGNTHQRASYVMDFVSWAAADFKFMPQAYPNDFPEATVPATMEHAVKSNWDKRVVHPTIGIYEGKQGWVTATEYVNQLMDAKQKGFTIGYSVYNGENMLSEHFRVLGEMHKRYPLSPMRDMTAAL